MIDFQKTGDWDRVRQILKASPERIKRSARKAMKAELHLLRRFMVEGIRDQKPGGKPIRPLARSTIATRQLKGTGGRGRDASGKFTKGGGTKALISSGDLIGSIAVVAAGGRWFVGVHRRAVTKSGRPVVDIAAINEFGSKPIVIPITPAMRRFLALLAKRTGHVMKGGPGGGGGRGRSVVVVIIPPRPFLQPAFNVWVRGVKDRFAVRVANDLPELSR